MKCPLYWVDAFTKTRFRGNPAAVVIADRGLDAGLMSASGPLHVTRAADRLALDFPARPASVRPDLMQSVAEALGRMPAEIHTAQASMAVFGSEDEVRSLKPDMDKVARIPTYGVVVTAPGKNADFVSRFFAPRVGVPEDPVTGSTHCTLVPYWSARLGKATLYAQQLSTRGGELWCEDRGHRVAIAGNCALYLTGEIEI
jgi:predicted PhzF superfamily epimerase YddE/YHI9